MTREHRGHFTQGHDGKPSAGFAEAGAEKLLNFDRSRWGIENKLHYVRNMTLRKEQSRIRHKGKVQIFCAVHNAIMALAALERFANVMDVPEIFGKQREKALLPITAARTE